MFDLYMTTVSATWQLLAVSLERI